MNDAGGTNGYRSFICFDKGGCWLAMMLVFVWVGLAPVAAGNNAALLAPAEPATAGSQVSLWLYDFVDVGGSAT